MCAFFFLFYNIHTIKVVSVFPKNIIKLLLPLMLLPLPHMPTLFVILRYTCFQGNLVNKVQTARGRWLSKNKEKVWILVGKKARER